MNFSWLDFGVGMREFGIGLMAVTLDLALCCVFRPTVFGHRMVATTVSSGRDLIDQLHKHALDQGSQVIGASQGMSIDPEFVPSLS